ncbi:MAG: hypothetical protein M0Z30_03495 [Actinomycetota bacterium]|nr:hypothetical protein [Actinomycetota bacterium]
MDVSGRARPEVGGSGSPGEGPGADVYLALEADFRPLGAPAGRRRPPPSGRRWRSLAMVLAAFGAGMGLNAVILRAGTSSHRPTAVVVPSPPVTHPSRPKTATTKIPSTTVPQAPLAWGSPVLMDPGHSPQAISCPSRLFCVAVDDHGQAISYVAGLWHQPIDIDGSQDISSVSCASADFCVAVDQAGNAITFDGLGWSRPVRVDNAGFSELTSVSCPTSQFCAAVDGNGNALVYRDGSWKAPTQVDPGGWTKVSRDVPSVSCPVAGSCVGVGPDQDVFYYVQGSWQSATSISPGQVAPTVAYRNAVSCVTAAFCVASENLGQIVVYDGTQWSAPVTIDPSDFIESVSCPTVDFCAAVDGLLPQGYNSGSGTANVLLYDGTTWSSPSNVDGEQIVDSIACPTADFCVAVDRAGDSVTGSG